MTRQEGSGGPAQPDPQAPVVSPRVDFSIGMGFRFGVGFALGSMVIWAMVMIPLIIIILGIALVANLANLD